MHTFTTICNISQLFPILLGKCNTVLQLFGISFKSIVSICNTFKSIAPISEKDCQMSVDRAFSDHLCLVNIHKYRASSYLLVQQCSEHTHVGEHESRDPLSQLHQEDRVGPSARGVPGQVLGVYGANLSVEWIHMVRYKGRLSRPECPRCPGPGPGCQWSQSLCRMNTHDQIQRKIE